MNESSDERSDDAPIDPEFDAAIKRSIAETERLLNIIREGDVSLYKLAWSIAAEHMEESGRGIRGILDFVLLVLETAPRSLFFEPEPGTLDCRTPYRQILARAVRDALAGRPPLYCPEPPIDSDTIDKD